MGPNFWGFYKRRKFFDYLAVGFSDAKMVRLPNLPTNLFSFDQFWGFLITIVCFLVFVLFWTYHMDGPPVLYAWTEHDFLLHVVSSWPDYCFFYCYKLLTKAKLLFEAMFFIIIFTYLKWPRSTWTQPSYIH